MSTTTRAPLGQPALIGGLVMGVLSALPVLSLGNVCCCLWVIAGGVVAAYVLQQNQSTPITPGDGALVGLLAGLIGAVVQVVISIPITLMVGPMERAILQRVVESMGNAPPEVRDTFERFGREGAAGAFWLISRFISFVMFLFLGAIFSTVGGVIGAALFKKNLPPGTIDVTPSAPTA